MRCGSLRWCPTASLCSPLEDRSTSPFQSVTELSCARCDHVRNIGQLFKLYLENIAGGHLLLFVLPYWQRWYELLATSAVDEEEIFLADLHAKLLLWIVELAYSPAFGESIECELARVRTSEFNDFQPCDSVAGFCRVSSRMFVVTSHDLWRRIKAAFEALDQNGPERSGTQI